MALTLLYFARLREDLDVAQEHIAFGAEVANVGALLKTLRQRGSPWAQALAPERSFRVAVNHTLAEDSNALADGDEVALFPPVTGG